MNFEISSPMIGQITEALSKAQGKIENALKDSKNPFFKSNYADLSSVMAVTKQPLTDNNLSFSTSIVIEVDKYILVATLSHSSGEWLRSYMPLITAKQDMQSLGAAISYARRFCLASLCHVGVEENDGEGTVQRDGLSEKQVTYLSDLVMKADDVDYIDKLCKHLQIKHIMDVSQKDFERTIGALNKKIEGNK